MFTLHGFIAMVLAVLALIVLSLPPQASVHPVAKRIAPEKRWNTPMHFSGQVVGWDEGHVEFERRPEIPPDNIWETHPFSDFMAPARQPSTLPVK